MEARLRVQIHDVRGSQAMQESPQPEHEWQLETAALRIIADMLRAIAEQNLALVDQKVAQLKWAFEGGALTERLGYQLTENVYLDSARETVEGPGGSVQLTPTELRLLTYLNDRKGRVVSAQELLKHVWEFPPGTGSAEVVRAHIRNLRRKSDQAGARQLIRTLSRRGYMIVAEE